MNEYQARYEANLFLDLEGVPYADREEIVLDDGVLIVSDNYVAHASIRNKPDVRDYLYGHSHELEIMPDVWA